METAALADEDLGFTFSSIVNTTDQLHWFFVSLVKNVQTIICPLKWDLLRISDELDQVDFHCLFYIF